MKIILFGATGGLGKEILKQGLQQGHEVKALVRNPNKIQEQSPLLEKVQVDVLKENSDSLANKLSGGDAVISSLGTGMRLGITKLYSQGTRNIIQAMQQAKISRLIVVSSSGTDPTTEEPWWYLWLVRRLLVNVYVDQARMEEQIIHANNLEWVIVRPSQLTNGNKQKYRVRLKHNPEKGYQISRADIANFMLEQLKSNTFINQLPALAY